MEIIKNNLVTITTTKIIDLNVIQSEIDNLQELHDSISYIEIPKGISEEIIELINVENQDREFKKADALNIKLQKEIEKLEYTK